MSISANFVSDESFLFDLAALNFTGTYMFGSSQVNGWFGVIGDQYITMATTVNDCVFVTSTRMGTMPDGEEFYI